MTNAMSETSLTNLSILRRLAGNPVQGPRFAKAVKMSSGVSEEFADPKANRAMVALMDAQAVMGGAASHWGGPAAFAELMSATHGVMLSYANRVGKAWNEVFNFVNDAGHCENGLYALRANYGWADVTLEELKTFRKMGSRLTGHGEAHVFPTGVLVSNGPLGSGLPQAQGLALADGWSGEDRTTICAISDGGCMEGEARESLAAIPGFARRGLLKPFVLIISDNNTKLSGRIDQDSFSMAPTFSALKSLGWKVLDLLDGNDLQACVVAIEAALHESRANPKIPIAIHARTVKGFGVKKTEESASGGHGFPLKDPTELKPFLNEIYAGEAIPAEFVRWCDELIAEHEAMVPKKSSTTATSGVKEEKVQAGVARALIRSREAGYPVVSISADLQGSTGLMDFHKKFKHAALDIGVAESNMVSTGIGLSLSGFIPVVDTFSQFGVTKGNLPLIMSALSQGPVIGVFSHAGFQDAADGASHQALTYFAATCAIPMTDVYALTSSVEAENLVSQAIEEFASERQSGRAPRSKIFFLGRENFPATYLKSDHVYELGRAQIVTDTATESSGQVVTIVAAGALLGEAIEAAKSLEIENIQAIVVNPSQINRPDVKTISSCLKRSQGNLITVEDHQVIGGMGSILVHALVQAQVPLRVRSLGVRDEFGRSSYTARELYQAHEMDRSAIMAAAKSLVSL